MTRTDFYGTSSQTHILWNTIWKMLLLLGFGGSQWVTTTPALKSFQAQIIAMMLRVLNLALPHQGVRVPGQITSCQPEDQSWASEAFIFISPP